MRRRSPEFVTTRWDLVAAAANKSDRTSGFEEGQGALNELCEIYRSPIVAFCRNYLRRVEDAEDVAQEFLVQMVEGRLLSGADRAKGRFRNLVLKTLKRFTFDLHDREKSVKRGGGVQFVPLFEADSLADEASVDLMFDSVWAEALKDQALDRLHKKFLKKDEAETFDILRPFLTGGVKGIEAEMAAEKLGVTLAAFHVRVHRFVEDFAKILRQEVARTVSAPHELEGELRHLIEVLAKSQSSL